MLLQECADDFSDVNGVLVRNEPRGDFGACPRRNDGFAAVALIAARQAVDLESWRATSAVPARKIRARRKVSGLRGSF